MKLIRKIKSYFIKHELHAWRDFCADKFDLKFRKLDEEVLLEIGHYIKSNLRESKQVGNKRHRLKEEAAIACPSLDQLLPVIRNIINTDYRETSAESVLYNWDFQYFLQEHKQCENTICISNALRANNTPSGNCIYPLATIRKVNNVYYCWNHLG